MDKILGQIDYDDIPSVEENKETLKAIFSCHSPMKLYEFIVKAKRKREFVKKRASKYSKFGVRLWSNEEEQKKTLDDEKWLKTYEFVYDDQTFWLETWKLRRKNLSEKRRGKKIYPIDFISYADDCEFEDDEQTREGGISVDEYFLRCVEDVLHRNSVYAVVKRVGLLLLNDQNLLKRLYARGKVSDVLKRWSELKLLPRASFYVSTLLETSSEMEKETESLKTENEIISVRNMQNAFYLMEKMETKCSSACPVEPPLSRSVSLTDVHFDNQPCRDVALYSSTFLRSVVYYCVSRFEKKNLEFLFKPTTGDETGVRPKENEVFYYDLKHNIIFDNASLFFKYNVYDFKLNPDSPFSENVDLYDDETDVINSCLEFSFEKIIEPEIIDYLTSKALSIKCVASFLRPNDDKSTCDSDEERLKKVRYCKWGAVISSFDEIKSISVLPCFIGEDADLVDCDDRRLEALRDILNSKHFRQSKLPSALRYLLKLFCVDLQKNVSELVAGDRGGSNSPELGEGVRRVTSFLTKKQFENDLYSWLTYADVAEENGINEPKDVEKFVSKHLLNRGGLKYDRIYGTVDAFSEVEDFVDEEEYEELRLEEEERKRRDFLPKKRMKLSDFNETLSSKGKKASHGNRRSEFGSNSFESDNDENKDDAPTREASYDDEDDSKGDLGSKDGENGYDASPPKERKKRKREVFLIVTNFHRDNSLFNDFLYSIG